MLLKEEATTSTVEFLSHRREFARRSSPSSSSGGQHTSSGEALSTHSLNKLNTIPLSLQKRIVKTKICVHNLSGRCNRASRCSFAHSAEELRAPPDLYKTRLCVDFMQSPFGCAVGAACKFAHGEMELRWTPEFYKTALCPFWNVRFICPSGRSCRWAHGFHELRHRVSPRGKAARGTLAGETAASGVYAERHPERGSTGALRFIKASTGRSDDTSELNFFDREETEPLSNNTMMMGNNGRTNKHSASYSYLQYTLFPETPSFECDSQSSSLYRRHASVYNPARITSIESHTPGRQGGKPGRGLQGASNKACRRGPSHQGEGTELCADVYYSGQHKQPPRERRPLPDPLASELPLAKARPRLRIEAAQPRALITQPCTLATQPHGLAPLPPAQYDDENQEGAPVVEHSPAASPPQQRRSEKNTYPSHGPRSRRKHSPVLRSEKHYPSSPVLSSEESPISLSPVLHSSNESPFFLSPILRSDGIRSTPELHCEESPILGTRCFAADAAAGIGAGVLLSNRYVSKRESVSSSVCPKMSWCGTVKEEDEDNNFLLAPQLSCPEYLHSDSTLSSETSFIIRESRLTTVLQQPVVTAAAAFF